MTPLTPRPTPTGRRTALRLLAISAATAGGACAPGSTSAPSDSAGSPLSAPSATAPASQSSAPAAEAPPGRQEIEERYRGRVPSWFDLAGRGIVSSTPSPGVCLTLDGCGGPGGSGADLALIDMLIGQEVPFTAFLNYRWVEANPGLTDRLAAETTVEIGNHGTAHLPLSVTGASAYGIRGTADAAAVWDEIMGNQEALTSRTGTAPRFFRPGTAYWDDVSVEIANDLGLVPAGLSINADGGATLPPAAVEAELRRARPGDIVISHLNQPEAGTGRGYAAAVPAMVSEGIRFLTLSQACGMA